MQSISTDIVTIINRYLWKHAYDKVIEQYMRDWLLYWNDTKQYFDGDHGVVANYRNLSDSTEDYIYTFDSGTDQIFLPERYFYSYSPKVSLDHYFYSLI